MTFEIVTKNLIKMMKLCMYLCCSTCSSVMLSSVMFPGDGENGHVAVL
jgi:hypothetical protein